MPPAAGGSGWTGVGGVPPGGVGGAVVGGGLPPIPCGGGTRTQPIPGTKAICHPPETGCIGTFGGRVIPGGNTIGCSGDSPPPGGGGM